PEVHRKKIVRTPRIAEMWNPLKSTLTRSCIPSSQTSRSKWTTWSTLPVQIHLQPKHSRRPTCDQCGRAHHPTNISVLFTLFGFLVSTFSFDPLFFASDQFWIIWSRSDACDGR